VWVFPVVKQSRVFLWDERDIKEVKRQGKSQTPGLDISFFACPAGKEGFGLTLLRQCAKCHLLPRRKADARQSFIIQVCPQVFHVDADLRRIDKCIEDKIICVGEIKLERLSMSSPKSTSREIGREVMKAEKRGRPSREHEQVYHASVPLSRKALSLTAGRLHGLKRACSGKGKKTMMAILPEAKQRNCSDFSSA
jgi:hypothetical protein